MGECQAVVARIPLPLPLLCHCSPQRCCRRRCCGDASTGAPRRSGEWREAIPTCAFVWFGSLPTARLAEYNGTGCKSTAFFFYFHHIIHATSALLASCYHPCCLHQPHRHPHQYRTRRVLMSSTPPASSFHRHRTRCVLMSSTPPASSFHRYRTRRVASYCTTSHCPWECCANNSRSLLIFTPRHICYRPCRHRQPHRHPH